LAKCVIEKLKTEKDIPLTLFLRNKKRLRNIDISECTVIESDVMNYNSLKNAIKGQDIVYVNLSGDLEGMAMNIVRAMKETGVKRIIAISSIGIYETPVSKVLMPYRKLADIIEESGLEYTILRLTWFIDSDDIDFELTRKGEPEKGSVISKKSLATFISEVIKYPDKFKNENLGINKPDS